MKHNKKRMPLWTLALLTAALLLFGAGGILGASAQLTTYSENFDTSFAMDHIGITLYENGKALNDKTLLTGVGDNIQPGKVYEERIAAKNDTNYPMYVRLAVKKYWTDKEGKRTNLDPALIELKFDTQKFNSEWQINPKESTDERSVYYLTKALPGGAESAALFNKLRINDSIVKMVKPPHQDGNVITVEYEYDGYTIGIEADVQGIQTHNANDAIKSIWGVTNVTESGGSLKVN